MDGKSIAPGRRNDLDWIRILAVLLLIPFHSARVFNLSEPFYVKNGEASYLATLVVGFLATWQMPLLFLVAGASTWYALRVRSGGEYVRERLKRLMIPFVFGTLVIVPPQMYLALLHRSNTSASFLEYYPQFFQLRSFDIPDFTGIGLSWAHLWFVLNLFVFSLIALPLFLRLKARTGQNVISRLAAFLDRGGAIFLMVLPLLIVADLPEVDGKPVFTHLTVFILGFILAADVRFRRAVERNRVVALLLGIATFSTMAAVEVLGVEFADDSPGDVSYFIVRNFNLCFWLVAILGFGAKYLNAGNRVLTYARDAAYPFYVLHQTVIVLVAFYVVQWSADPLLKYVAVMACSFVATIAIYELAVRRVNPVRFLFGMKPAAQVVRAPAIS